MSEIKLSEKQKGTIWAMRQGSLIEYINRKFYCTKDFSGIDRKEVSALVDEGLIVRGKSNVYTITEAGKTIEL